MSYLHRVTIIFHVDRMCSDGGWCEFSVKSTLYIAFDSNWQLTMRTSHTNSQFGCATPAYTNMKCRRLLHSN